MYIDVKREIIYKIKKQYKQKTLICEINKFLIS